MLQSRYSIPYCSTYVTATVRYMQTEMHANFAYMNSAIDEATLISRNANQHACIFV